MKRSDVLNWLGLTVLLGVSLGGTVAIIAHPITVASAIVLCGLLILDIVLVVLLLFSLALVTGKEPK